MRLKQTWEQFCDARTVGLSWMDLTVVPGGKPVNEEARKDFWPFNTALKTKAGLLASTKDNAAIASAVDIALDQNFSSADENKRWVLTITLADGTVLVYTLGQVIAERCMPLGFDDGDRDKYQTGVDENGNPGAGHWELRTAPNSSGLMIEWVPDKWPVAVKPVPGSTQTTLGDLSNQTNGFDNGNFTNKDRAMLADVQGRLDRNGLK